MAPKKQAIDAKRGNLFMVDPWKITLVWDDADQRLTKQLEDLISPDVDLLDPTHPLYDEKIFLPVEESQVRSVMKKGVILPAPVRKNGTAVEAIDGRQRVKWARLANIRLKEAGEPEIRVPCIVKRGTDADSLSLSIAANEIRTVDEVVNKAKKANRLTEMGYSEEEVAESFGVVVNTVKNWQKLLDLDTSVQKACRVGNVPVSEAIKWHKDPRDKQREHLKNYKAAVKTRSSDPYKGKNGTKTKRPRKPTKAKVRALIEALPESKTKSALQWSLGDLTTRKAKEIIKELKGL